MLNISTTIFTFKGVFAVNRLYIPLMKDYHREQTFSDLQSLAKCPKQVILKIGITANDSSIQKVNIGEMNYHIGCLGWSTGTQVMYKRM